MQWNLDFMARSDQGEQYLELAQVCAHTGLLLHAFASLLLGQSACQELPGGHWLLGQMLSCACSHTHQGQH